MPYSALAIRLLISCPGDVPAADIRIVQQAITKWNGIYGENFGAAVVPIMWSVHAAAAFGRPPQDELNDQIVDRCDVCIAMFGTRLGTPTAVAASGTAEEIERLGAAGKYVGVLRSRRPVDPGGLDIAQMAALQTYLDGLRPTALVLGYADDAQLSDHVEKILVAAVSAHSTRAATLSAPSTVPGAEVWPRVQSEDRVRIDSHRWASSLRNRYLVLHNTGSRPALGVTFVLEKDPTDRGDLWTVALAQPGDPSIDAIAPGGEVRFALVAQMGSAQQVRCVVRWSDDRGSHENMSTLRLT
ncbi:hypothetical protein AB0C04_16090 [Micromonospora sp. NPDC048909]|uniref:hypothetical protein n=1 Tax=Micromonospora sp. NPDC048909 TaxID=3155643 RepID=UPI0033D6C6CB